MSWSLEVFSARENQVAIAELTAKLSHDIPQVAIHHEPAIEPVDHDDTATSAPLTGPEPDIWTSLALVRAGDPASTLAQVQATAFQTECADDPQLLSNLVAEIALSDAEDDTVDEQYTGQLSQILRNAQWHYIVSVGRNDDAEQECLVVQITYALSQLTGGLVHDLQSGAWMDANLYESLLDAYGTTEA